MQNDPQIRAAHAILKKRIREFADKAGISSFSAISWMLNVSRSQVTRYLDDSDSTVPTPAILRRIRAKIPEITDEETSLIETAFSRAQSLSKAEGAKTLKAGRAGAAPQSASFPQAQKPAEKGFDAEKARECLRLLSELIGGSGAPTGETADKEAKDFARRYVMDGIPHVLTEDNYRQIKADEWSRNEVQAFAKKLIEVFEEARRGVIILAQISPDSVRAEINRRLRGEAILLWRQFQVATHVAPEELIKEIELAGIINQITGK